MHQDSEMLESDGKQQKILIFKVFFLEWGVISAGSLQDVVHFLHSVL